MQIVRKYLSTVATVTPLLPCPSSCTATGAYCPAGAYRASSSSDFIYKEGVTPGTTAGLCPAGYYCPSPSASPLT